MQLKVAILGYADFTENGYHDLDDYHEYPNAIFDPGVMMVHLFEYSLNVVFASS